MAIPRRQQRQPGPDRRMPNGPQKATNIAPRFNNNAGSQAAGRRRNPGPQGRRPIPGGQSGGFDYNAFNAWQDPSIGGAQPGPIQEGWGGFANTSDPLLKIKMNNYLNQFSTGGDRETQMNQIGYFNQGNAYNPSRPDRGKAFNKWTDQIGKSLGPNGTYQLQSSGAYGAGSGVSPNMNFGGYEGIVTPNAERGGGQFRSLSSDPRNQGPTGARPNQARPGGGGGSRLDPREWQGGFGGGGPRGGGGGGGNNRGPGGGGGGGRPGGNNNGPGGNGGGGRPGYPGKGTPGKLGEYPNIPAPQTPEDYFLPLTPQFEAGRRGLADEQMAQQEQIMAQQAMVDPLYQQQKARLETDRGYDVERMKEQLAQRGVFTPYGARGGMGNGQNVMGDPLSTGGGIGEYLGTRDIRIPYGRQFSDLATGAAGQYGALNNAFGDTELAYNQGMAELLLNRAADASANIPMNVPQYSTGNRILRAQGYNNRPNKPPKKNSRRNRGGSKRK